MRVNGSYKDLVFIFDEDLNSAEFVINSFDLRSAEAYINFIALVSEYAMIEKPDYIIFNKKESGFVLDKSILTFTKGLIFNQLKSSGVSKIIMVVNLPLYESIYKDIEKRNSLMKSFLTLEEAYSWILANRNMV